MIAHMLAVIDCLCFTSEIEKKNQQIVSLRSIKTRYLTHEMDFFKLHKTLLEYCLCPLVSFSLLALNERNL